MKRAIYRRLAWVLLLSIFLGDFSPLYAAEPIIDSVDMSGDEEIPSQNDEISLLKSDNTIAEAFPCSYTEDWLTYFCDNYPSTRDQGPYRCCWSNTAIGLAEFYAVKHGLASKDVDFSELHLSYWTYTHGNASAAAGDTGDSVSFCATDDIPNILQNSGDLKYASETLMRQRGLVAEEVLPYSCAEDLISGNLALADTERQNSMYLENAYMISIRHNPQLVKEAILENGAVGITIREDSKYYVSENNAYYCNEEVPGSAYHALCVVGWDDYFPASSFVSENRSAPSTDGAWLVRNSRSTSSEASYNSYFWLSYQDVTLAGAWIYQLAESYPYDNHYYYDSQIHANAYYNSVTEFANVFTVNGEGASPYESLEAVTFEMALANIGGSHYRVEVYADLQGDTPDTGTLIRSATTEGTVFFEGSYTVSLNHPVILERGERFAVVISFDETGSSVVLEAAIDRLGAASSSVGIESGQSFVSTDRKNWSDVKSGDRFYGNLVISALTSDTPTKPKISRISLSPEWMIVTQAEESISLNTVLYDSNDKEADISEYSYIHYQSSDSSVVTVNESGVLQIVGNGEARILATYDQLSAGCDIIVKLSEEGQTAIPVPDKRDGSTLVRGDDTLSLQCHTPGAKIYYTIDGSTPDSSSTEYTGAICFPPETINTQIPFKAVAIADGYTPSDILSYRYQILSKGKLRLSSPANITTISTTEKDCLKLQAKLFYDEAEEIPADGFFWHAEQEDLLQISTVSGQESFRASLSGLQNGSTVVWVSANNAAKETHSASINITVNIATTQAPTVYPADNSVLYAGKKIFLNTDSSDTVVYYTLDGSDPKENGIIYKNYINITEEQGGKILTLRAYAVKNGCYPSSEISAIYKVKRGKEIKLSPMDPVPLVDPYEYETLYLVRGQSFTLDSSTKWLSSDPKVAKVGKNGTIILKKSGNARIGPANALDSNGHLKEGYDVIVASPVIAQKKVQMIPGDVLHMELLCNVNVKDAESGEYTNTDFSAQYTNLYWHSSREDVVSIDYDGNITARSKGSAVITAYVCGTAVKARVTVKDSGNVSAKVTAGSETEHFYLLPYQTLKLKFKGFKANKICWRATGDGGQLRPVYKWLSTKPDCYENKVIRITPSGKIAAIGPGTCTISGTDAKGVTISFIITVRNMPEQRIYLRPGKTKRLAFRAVNDHNTFGVWSVSGDVIEFTETTASIKAVSNGEALVSLYYDPYQNGNGFTYRTRIYVCEAELVTDDQLYFKNGSYTLYLSLSEEDPYTLCFNGETYTKALFTGNKKSIAFADEDGRIYPRSVGKTNISTTIYGQKIKIKVIVSP